MLQIRDLVWGLLFIGFAGKKLSYLSFILGYVEIISRVGAKAKSVKNEGRAVLILEQHPRAARAGGILAADSGQWRWGLSWRPANSPRFSQKVSDQSESCAE